MAASTRATRRSRASACIASAATASWCRARTAPPSRYLLVSRNAVGELFAADVYCESPAGGAIDAVAAAFGWMARERVAVINVSLVGPRNALLERVVKTLVERGHLIVAAVGNDGPAAPPLYPASYDGVVGVTAVDAKHRVLIEACRGKHVDFAAHGADMSAAAGAPDVLRATCAALRSPRRIVTALLGMDLAAPDPARRSSVLAKLERASPHDLGKPRPRRHLRRGRARDADAARTLINRVT